MFCLTSLTTLQGSVTLPTYALFLVLCDKTLAMHSVIWRESPGYEEARVGRIFNHRRPDRYPRGIIEATSAQDVVDATQLAAQMNLRVSVRSGGHSWAAWSVRDDAILIDLGKFKCLELDEATAVVKVSPSTTGRVLNAYLATKGKMFAGGHCPDVGLGGFLLQGGMGWNCKVSLTLFCKHHHIRQLLNKSG